MTSDGEGRQVLLDLRELYPEHDEWLYEASSEIVWTLGAPAGDGKRGAQRCSSPTFTNCWFKADLRLDDADAMKDKMASDLAQIAGVSVPPSLLARSPVNNHPAVVTKEPPGQFVFTIEQYSLIYQARFGTDGWKRDLATIYPAELVALDIWTGNGDRAINYKNTLVVEYTQQPTVVWGIDYNVAFGYRGAPWDNGGYKEPGFEAENFPLPKFVDAADVDRQRLRQAANLIAGIRIEAIQQIARRCAGFYGTDQHQVVANTIEEGLIYRQKMVFEWANLFLN